MSEQTGARSIKYLYNQESEEANVYVVSVYKRQIRPISQSYIKLAPEKTLDELFFSQAQDLSFYKDRKELKFPKGQKKQLVQMLRSPDVESVEYAIGICKACKK